MTQTAPETPDPSDTLVIMGRVAAPYAVRGWIRVQTFTEYLDSLLDYPIWQLGRNGRWQAYRLLDGRVQGQMLVAQLEGINDRDQAERLRGMEVAVGRDERPGTDEDEYYWDELIGLEVVNQEGVSLGRVRGLLETGAHDVLEVEGERKRLIPFTEPIVQEVDTAAGVIRVDWAADY